MKITIERVTTLEQAQELRRLRNECRLFMTRDPRLIGRDRQRGFYGSRIVPGTVRAWLLYAGGSADTRAVAFGLLRASEGVLWLSCGVASTHRGNGLGTALVKLVTAAGMDSGMPVKLEVWADNERAVHVYEKAGYVLEGTSEREGRALKVMIAR